MENKTKVGVIGVISFPLLLFAIFLTGIFLGGDISWATNHVGVNFFINDLIDLFLIASVFTVSVIVVTDDWLSDNKYKGNELRVGSSLAKWGVYIYVVTFSSHLLGRGLKNLFIDPLKYWMIRDILNWVLYVGLVTSLILSIPGIILYTASKLW